MQVTLELKLKMTRIRGKFLDTLRLHVKGGTGGTGLPRYGGIGGNGGDVYVEAVKGKVTIVTHIYIYIIYLVTYTVQYIGSNCSIVQQFVIMFQDLSCILPHTEHTLFKTMIANPKKRWSGNLGGNSRRFCIVGEAGKDVTIPVPKGVTVKLEGRKSMGEQETILIQQEVLRRMCCLCGFTLYGLNYYIV